MKIITFFILLLFIQMTKAQYSFEEINFSDLDCHARGITANKKWIYVSTNIGKVYQINPKTKKVKDLKISQEKINGELRDLEFSSDQLICMESGENGNIYLSNGIKINLGKVFLDGIDFYKNVGFAMGDQVDNCFSLFYSLNNGETWILCPEKVKSNTNENAFAASGSTVHCLNDSTFIFVSGGSESNIFKSTNRGNSWSKFPIPFEKGESSGAFSISFQSEKECVVVGGDYQKPDYALNNCFISKDGGKSWTKPNKGPCGYRSCVLYHNGIYFSCGTNGLDYSLDQGENWKKVNQTNYLSMSIFKNTLAITTSENKIHLYKLELFQ
jgi:hypothetical protein